MKSFEEGPKANIHVDLLRATLKKILNWKTLDFDGIHRFWFKKFTSIHDRLAIEINRCLQETDIPEWMAKGKKHPDPERSPKMNRYKQL